jgi:3'(2'), 5'-bisphosphate nucleotidase
MDSQAKYATVARGFADAYLRLPTKTGYFEKIWDHAGGIAVVEEAGGRVTDVAGKTLDFSRGRELNQNRGVIVTNGLLHDQIVAAVQSVLSSDSNAV